MFFALCGPVFPFEELLELSELLMDFASWCALFVLAVIVFAKCADARQRKSAQRFYLGLNDG
jgi:hypothetical protein